MRLAAQAKAGYYPTPPDVVDLVRCLVRFPEGPFAALDPCCGAGEALAAFLNGTEGVGYGIELGRERAGAARERLPRVIAGAFEYCRVSPGSFSVLWLNPPYDHLAESDPERRLFRQEYTFLTASTRLLVSGGLLVYVIPQHLLGHRDVSEYLAARYTGLQVGAFPAAVNLFRQVVVLGRRQNVSPAGRGAVREWLRGLAGEEPGTPALPELPCVAAVAGRAEPLVVPQTPAVVRNFISLQPSPEDLYADSVRSELWQEVRRRTEVQPAGIVRDRPPMTLRAGHLPLLVAGGAFNGVVGEGDEQHLAKGTVRYEVITSEEELGDGKVEYRETRVPRVSVAVLTGGGHLLRLL